MTTVATESSTEKALERLRTYTTFSFVGIVGVFAVTAVLQLPSFGLTTAAMIVSAGVILVAGIASGVVVAHWERRGPKWLEVTCLSVIVIAWVVMIAVPGTPGLSLVLALALGAIAVRERRGRGRRALFGAVALFVPLVAAALLRPESNWFPWFVVTAVAYVMALALATFSMYTWGLYLQLDSARRGAAALAVAQERYRFAADLHDIQGHTLHIIRLKTRLARKLLESDSDGAREHLLEAEELINETLANTRSLAFGDRRVTLSAELANAEQLFAAAGIHVAISGDAAAIRDDELFGLALRETTTNILRHSQAATVRIAIEPTALTIVNDGSSAAQRPPSGLARLGERFEERGGTLRTRADEGRFTTEALLP